MYSFTNFLLHKRCPYLNFCSDPYFAAFGPENLQIPTLLTQCLCINFQKLFAFFFFQLLIFKNQQKVVPAKIFLPLCSKVRIATFERFIFYISLFRSGHAPKFFVGFYSFSPFLKNYPFSHLLAPFLILKNTSVTPNSRSRRFESVSNNFKTYNWGQN